MAEVRTLVAALRELNDTLKEGFAELARRSEQTNDHLENIGAELHILRDVTVEGFGGVEKEIGDVAKNIYEIDFPSASNYYDNEKIESALEDIAEALTKGHKQKKAKYNK